MTILTLSLGPWNDCHVRAPLNVPWKGDNSAFHSAGNVKVTAIFTPPSVNIWIALGYRVGTVGIEILHTLWAWNQVFSGTHVIYKPRYKALMQMSMPHPEEVSFEKHELEACRISLHLRKGRLLRRMDLHCKQVVRNIFVCSKRAVDNLFTKFYSGKKMIKYLGYKVIKWCFQAKEHIHIIFMEKVHNFELSGFILATSTSMWARRVSTKNATS